MLKALLLIHEQIRGSSRHDRGRMWVEGDGDRHDTQPPCCLLQDLERSLMPSVDAIEDADRYGQSRVGR
jgi:hypothetical protein